MKVVEQDSHWFPIKKINDFELVRSKQSKNNHADSKKMIKAASMKNPSSQNIP